MKFKVKSFICLTFDIRVFMARELHKFDYTICHAFDLDLTHILRHLYQTFD